MISILFWSFFVGLSVPGFVLAVRTLPPIAMLVQSGVKPWACDVCSCFWSAAVASLLAFLHSGPEALFAAGPGYTIALGLLGLMQAPPAVAPPLEDSAPEPPPATPKRKKRAGS